MIDLFTLALTHGLIALALWRMLVRDDLDLDEGDSRSSRAAGPREARNATDEGHGGD